MTAASIPSDSASTYAEYLDGKAADPGRGDYYLGRDGMPAEAPGRWHAPTATLVALGIDPVAAVERDDLEALMEGRHPRSGRDRPRWLRRAGADGTRAAGIDITFSAPKSVSIAWALSSGASRDGLEAAHRAAVAEALAYLRETVPTLAVYRGPGVPPGEVTAAGLIAAEFVHTTARGVEGGVPDPQLHSHCLITGVVRGDGTVAAVRSRPVFRAAREVGAFYRASLAWQLAKQGYAIEHSTGRDGRYFELAGISQDVRAVFSKRTVEVTRAADVFRARHGRAPKRGELRLIKLASRQAKQPRTREQLNHAWQATARQAGLHGTDRLPNRVHLIPAGDGAALDWRRDVEVGLTRTRATFTKSELRTTALEQAPGRIAPLSALRRTRALRESGLVLDLENGRMTTARIRAQEQRVLVTVERLTRNTSVRVSDRARDAAAQATHERLGNAMALEQEQALQTLTGPERAAVLIGPAGTGKGVVIDAVARAENGAGRHAIGVAVAGATAERLGRDSPTLQGATLNVDALLARVAAGAQTLTPDTTVIFDEAGMADTDRLERLTTAIEQAGSKLVLVGDPHQLASIGPGGLFARLARIAPTAELAEVRRTADPAEREAWRQLRAGTPEAAMAHYRARGQLHLQDTRDQALEAAVQRYDELATEHGVCEVALMTDGPNTEVERMNARAQYLRAQRGQLGAQQLALPAVSYGLRAGDRVVWTAPQLLDEQPRVENGSRGDVIAINPDRAAAQIRLDGSDREITVSGDALGALRLGYAQHLYRQQGATVERAVTLTGGWQTSRESAYVQASRARAGINWHLSREDLGHDGHDDSCLDRLAASMRTSSAQTPSITFALEDPRDIDTTPARSLIERGYIARTCRRILERAGMLDIER